MNHDLFEERLLAWIDGELPVDQADEMQAFVDSNPELADRVAAERRFEDQFRDALLRTVDFDADAKMSELLDRARPAAEATASSARALRPAPSRVLRLLRPLTGVAAALLLATSLSWFYCIGPFECPYLEAVERVVEDPNGTPAAAVEVPGYESEGEASVRSMVSATHGGEVLVMPLECPHHGAFHLVIGEADSGRPSFRRRIEHDGHTWWMGEEAGKRFVAFVHPERDQLVWLVGQQDEDELLAIAQDVYGKSF